MELIGHTELQTISLNQFVVNHSSTSIFASLMYQLATNRPDVVCYLDQLLPLEV